MYDAYKVHLKRLLVLIAKNMFSNIKSEQNKCSCNVTHTVEIWFKSITSMEQISLLYIYCKVLSSNAVNI